MPIPVPRDLEAARRAIQAWLCGRRPEAGSLAVSELSSPGMTGFSNETLIFDVSWTEDGRLRSESLVIRVRPTGHRIFLEDDFELQYQVMAELGRRQAPVPAVHDFEADPSVLGAP
ncbi:MAG: phosphotransferase family protein, partial [Acidimicrobiales bacterium]